MSVTHLSLISFASLPGQVRAAAVATVLILANEPADPFGSFQQEVLNAEGVKDDEVRSLADLNSGPLAASICRVALNRLGRIVAAGGDARYAAPVRSGASINDISGCAPNWQATSSMATVPLPLDRPSPSG